MDIDMDLDLEVEVPEEAFVDESGDAQMDTTAAPTTQINPFGGSVVGAGDIAFEKVHVRGLDNIDQRQLNNYIGTYFDSPHFNRIEWIDDTSANFVYNSTSAASEALVAFSNTDIVDIAQLDTLALRPAKVLQVTKENGDVENHQLQIRQATTSDVKEKKAHEKSRFYLMHPEKDPREQRFKERRDRIRGNVENGDYRRMRRRGSEGDDGYRPERFDNRERKRRLDDDQWNENMYDEGGSGSRSTDEEERRKRVRFGRRDNRDKDLFSGRTTGRLRDRSASPFRGGEGDGRYGFGADPDTDMNAIRSNSRRAIRQRSLTPPRQSAQPNSNAGKELFATRALAPAANIELFPQKAARSSTSLLSASNDQSTVKELFPEKTHTTRKSFHRRSAAIDASPERYNQSVQNGGGGGPDRPRSLADRISGTPSSLSLADRITRPSSSSGTAPGRSLADRITRDGDDDGGITIRGSRGLSIKGQAQNEGLSIKGADNGGGGVRELFPGRAGANAGKELFTEKLKGRGVARRTAASYF